MTFTLFYVIALIPVIVGAVLWVTHREVHWIEWLLCSAVGFATSGAMHLIAARGMTSDQEIWSGEVLSVVYRPEWQERYTVTHEETHTRSDGSTYTTSYTTTHHRTHPDEWHALTSLDQRLEISPARYRQIGQAFGGESKPVRGDRRTNKDNSRMVSGDPYDYVVANRTQHIEPVTDNVAFENRVKVSPSVFSYRTLPEEVDKALPDYPYSSDPWVSERVIGAPVSVRRWDEMLARLGPEKRVNLILVRLPTRADALDLEAKWAGGKKNDLVLCYGAGWSHVFGWSERERVKRELETLLLGKVDDALLPAIDRTVREYYELVDWDKFSYLELRPRMSHLIWLIVVMIISQGLMWGWAVDNDMTRRSRVWGRF